MGMALVALATSHEAPYTVLYARGRRRFDVGFRIDILEI